MNINKLKKANKIKVSYIDYTKVDAQFIIDLREKYELSIVDLSNIVGVSQQTIKRWETGVNKPNRTCSILLTLINDDKTILDKIYSVKIIKNEE